MGIGWGVPVLAAMVVLVFVIGWKYDNTALGCGWFCFLVVVFVVGTGLAIDATAEESRDKVYITDLVALSDSVQENSVYLGSGTVGAVPTYFYSYRTPKGIVHDTLQKRSLPVYIVEEETVRPRLEQRVELVRRFRKDDKLWTRIVWSAFGFGGGWSEKRATIEYYFIVPKGSIQTGAVIDTQ